MKKTYYASYAQIKIIHIQKAKLGLDDEAYRDLLATFGVKSSKELVYAQANVLIERLGGTAPQPYSKKRFNELGARDKSMATPAQLRKIESMWAMVSFVEDTQERRIALDRFVKRITGKGMLRWVTHTYAVKLIAAIENMKKPE